MDSITHALYKVVSETDMSQRLASGDDKGGLQPIATRKSTHMAYSDAAGTDLHISVSAGGSNPLLLALAFEFIAAGLTPPASLVSVGCDVIISPGRLDVICETDNANATWSAILTSRIEQRGAGHRRTSWEEQVS